MPSVSVRYIVDDVDDAIRFYVDHLGFREVMHPAPSFAMLERGDLRLVLSKPGGGPGGGASMPDGSVPTPGGWNRFALEVDDVEALLASLAAAGVHARSPIIDGVGGRQVIVDDPSGNPVELFQPTIQRQDIARRHVVSIEDAQAELRKGMHSTNARSSRTRSNSPQDIAD